MLLLTKWRESTQYSSDPAFWDIKGIEIRRCKVEALTDRLLKILMFAMFLT